MHIKKIPLLFCIATLTACTTHTPQSSDAEIRLSADNLPRHAPVTIGFSIDTIRFIPLQSSSENLIGTVRKAQEHDGYYYILSESMLGTDSQLSKFDSDGNFITHIGTTGNGPGEYIRIHTFWIDNDSIYLFDAPTNKVHIYSLGGEWIRDQSDTNLLKFAKDVTSAGKGKALIANSISFRKELPLYMTWSPAHPLDIDSIIPSRYTSEGSYEFSKHPMAPNGNTVYFLYPLSGYIGAFDISTQTVRNAFVLDHIKEGPEEGNYPNLWTERIMNKERIITDLFCCNDFLIINLTQEVIFWDMRKETGVSVENEKMAIGDEAYNRDNVVFPFIPAMLTYTQDDECVMIIDAEEFIRIAQSLAENPAIDRSTLPLEELDEDSNPVIVRYKIGRSPIPKK